MKKHCVNFFFFYSNCNKLVRTARMEPTVQKTVDTVLKENSVTMSTGPVKMGARLGITIPTVK